MDNVHESMNRRSISDITIWVLFLFILFVKSEVLLGSIYGMTLTVFIFGSISIIPILFIQSFAFCFSTKGAFIYLLLCDAIISIVFLADLIYARAFGHLVSVYMLFTGDAIEGIQGSVLSLIHFTDWLMLIDLPFLLIFLYKAKRQNQSKRNIILFIFSCTISLTILICGFNLMVDKNQLADNNFHPLLLSPIGNHLYDLFRFVYDRNEGLNQNQITEIEDWIEANQKYLVAENEYLSLKGLIQGKNIITIQFESLEKFVINASFDGFEVTPNLNNMLDHSIYFSNIVEQVEDGNSSDAELMFNTSLYPISSGSAFLRFGKNEYNSLPMLLRQQGYTSVAIHGDTRSFWNRDQVFPNLGFDKYIDESMFEDAATSGMGILDESLFHQINLEIEDMKQPFNVFAITLTSHIPFELDRTITSTKAAEDDISSRYLNSIHYADMAMGTFYNQLETSGMLNNSVFVIYGDHEGLHKYYDTNLPDNNYRVPFIIYIPGFDGFEMDKVGGQIDMMPTLTYLLGIDDSKYANSVMGRNLFGNFSGSGILASGIVIEGTDGESHLKKAAEIADMWIKGDYTSLSIK